MTSVAAIAAHPDAIVVANADDLRRAWVDTHCGQAGPTTDPVHADASADG